MSIGSVSPLSSEEELAGSWNGIYQRLTVFGLRPSDTWSKCIPSNVTCMVKCREELVIPAGSRSTTCFA